MSVYLAIHSYNSRILIVYFLYCFYFLLLLINDFDSYSEVTRLQFLFESVSV